MFSPFFFQKILNNKNSFGAVDFEFVHSWTNDVNLFQKDYVLIPLCMSEHWSLIIICYPGQVALLGEKNMDGSTEVPCILHFDSIKGRHADARIEETIRRYLFDHWKVKEGVNEQENERIENNFLSLKFSSLELPMQENSYDCGVFLLHYVEQFLELTSNRTTDFMEQLDQNCEGNPTCR
ncbi:probable ubiquitin-like-specific protease 2B [Salvia miltiorrhiza]|uniref:probable ubiquitin-like-specific protease 2B n=1 Tax=Salvia miltiorrhiza TaxID=226208 RepID=UPI0025ACD4BE|nr:probable ubiquitin-like-specific protease 2B [Salvia miltiorrhiza]